MSIELNQRELTLVWWAGLSTSDRLRIATLAFEKRVEVEGREFWLRIKNLPGVRDRLVSTGGEHTD